MTQQATVRWTDRERAIARSDLPLARIKEMLPTRTAASISQKRLGLPRRRMDMSALGKRSGAARLALSIEAKNKFIVAVGVLGATLTNNGVVSRSTYRLWTQRDPSFFEWFRTFKSRRAAERAASKAATARPVRVKKPVKKPTPAGPTLSERLRSCDVYEVARAAIGNVQPQFVREEAISSMVMALIEGVIEQDEAKAAAKKYVSRARREVSYVSADAPLREGGMSRADMYTGVDETSGRRVGRPASY